MTRVSVVILNYNGQDLLRKFLPAVIMHSGDAAIVVADNGSTDGSVDLLRTEFPGVRVILLPRNYGFCGGYNRALAEVESDYVVLLNSDVEVTPGWLSPLTHILDLDATAGAVQPKILSWRGKERFEYAGAGGGFIDSLGYPFCRGRVFNHIEYDLGQYDDEREIFWSSGACMMVRTGVFRELGGFDEDFFAHMEEIDLCWKLQRAGLKVFYSGKSTVYHVGAGTLGYENPAKTYLNFRNGLTLIFKHLDTAEMIFKIPLRIAFDWLAAVVFLFRGQLSGAAAVFRAHGHFIRDLSRNVRKRREIRSSRPTYTRKNVYPGLIIVDYYLRGKKTLTVSNPR